MEQGTAARRLAWLAAALLLVAAVGIFARGRSSAAQTSGDWRLTVGSTGSLKAYARTVSPYGPPTMRALPPQTRVVGFAGAPQSAELGILGDVGLERGAARLVSQSKAYERQTRPVTRMFDLIATVAEAHPGQTGLYRSRQSGATIARWLRAARRSRAQLLLDIQPGGSNFVDETAALSRWLREPDVHLALDPEWRMRPGVAPGTEIGWVSHGELQATLDRVAALVQREQLPPKLVVVHRFTDGMIKDLDRVKVPGGVVPVISIDGVGSRPLKIDTYKRIAPHLPKPWRPGFKLFFREDAEAGGLMSGSQVMALEPRPAVVLYE